MRSTVLLAVAAFLLTVPACSKPQGENGRQQPAIALQGRVTDAANVLSVPFEARLSDRLRAYEDRTKHQVVVVTAASLNGLDVADFTRDLANRWGIGRKGHDDGVVILVAPADKKVRIEVGLGLEKTLTNERAACVIQLAMIPRFRVGDIEAGIVQGAEALIATMDEAERSLKTSLRKSC